MGRLNKFKSFMKGAGLGLLFVIGITVTTIFVGEIAIYLGPIISIPAIWVAMAIIGIGFIISMGVVYAITDY